MTPYYITQHAQMRMRQRGIRDADMALLARYADMEHPVGRNLCALQLSRRALRDAKAAGVSVRRLDRLSGLVAVESLDGTLVTAAHICGRKAAAYNGHSRRKYWLR